jgi:uncharacterized protein (DUF362 family)
MSLVSFVKIQESTIASMNRAILQALDQICYSFNKDVRNVIIKPNLCYYWDYSTGQTTDPRFVAAVIDVIRGKIPHRTNISIVESDASAMKCEHVFKILGYEKLAENYGVTLVNLSKEKADEKDVMVGGHSFHVAVPRIIQDADLRINIPKIKYTIRGIKITCALKNIFGCNPYEKKFRYHPRLGEVIVAVNKAMRFDLCLVDGNVVSGVRSRRLGLVMASKDLVAIDVAAARIAGEDPSTIRYIELAYKEGLGNKSFVSKGVALDYFKERYPRKTARNKLISNAFRIVVLSGMAGRLGIE